MARSMRWTMSVGGWLLAAGLISAGCSANYNGERLFWKAQRLNAAMAKESQPSSEQTAAVVAAFNRVIQKTPGTSWAAQSHLIIGSLYATQKRYSEARETYHLLLQNYNQYKELSLSGRLAIAKTYEAEDNWAEAVKCYREISEYHPWSRMGLEAPVYIAAMHEQRQERDQAVRAYEFAVKRYSKMIPDSPNPDLGSQAKGYLALAYQRLGDWDQAINVLEDLSANVPETNRPLVLLTLASIYQTKLGSARKAEETYAKLLRDFPDHPMGKVAKAQLGNLWLGQPPAAPSSDTPPQEPTVLSAPAPSGVPIPAP